MEWKPLRGSQKKCDKEMEKRDMKLLRSCKKLLKKLGCPQLVTTDDAILMATVVRSGSTTGVFEVKC